MKLIKVVRSSTGEVVRRIDVTGKSESSIEKIERGLLRNMDTSEFHTEETEGGEPSELRDLLSFGRSS